MFSHGDIWNSDLVTSPGALEEMIRKWKRSCEPSRGTRGGTAPPRLCTRMSLHDTGLPAPFREATPLLSFSCPYPGISLGGNRHSSLLPFPCGGGLHQRNTSGLTLSFTPDWRRHPVSTFWTAGARPSRQHLALPHTSSLDEEVGVSALQEPSFPWLEGPKG